MGGVWTSVFNNGWIMIPLEQRGPQSPSAAGRFRKNALKTEHNYLIPKQLDL